MKYLPWNDMFCGSVLKMNEKWNGIKYGTIIAHESFYFCRKVQKQWETWRFISILSFVMTPRLVGSSRSTIKIYWKSHNGSLQAILISLRLIGMIFHFFFSESFKWVILCVMWTCDLEELLTFSFVLWGISFDGSLMLIRWVETRMLFVMWLVDNKLVLLLIFHWHL